MQTKHHRVETSKKDYTDEEFAFIRAMEAYIIKTNHKFPSFTEVLAVAKSLGYRKIIEHG